MRTLLLTSAGMEVKDEILKILPKSPEQTRVAYITTAANPAPNPWWVDEDKKRMEKVGLQVTNIDIKDKKESELQELLKGFDVIFVQGGNTFYLLKYVRESGFDTVVKELLEQGVIYIGVSAGSQIIGSSVEVAGWYYHLLGGPDENTVGLTDFIGMNLVPFQIFVHYIPQDAKEVKRQREKSQHPVRILTNNQAFLVQDDTITLVGKGDEIKV